MPDTGAPWNIPYVESTDLVSDWPTDSLALANAIDSGLDAAGGLVAVKHALFTGTQTNSTAAGANFAVTDLSITHEVADASNKLIVHGYVGVLGSSSATNSAAVAVYDGSSLLAVGDAAGDRSRVTAGGSFNVPDNTFEGRVANSRSFTFVHTPGSGSKTYTLRVINTTNTTRTMYVGRTEGDADSEDHTRGSAALVIQEVKV